MRDRLDKIIQTTLAGAVAERKVRGRWNNIGCASDREHATELGGYRYPWGTKSFDLYMKLMLSVAEDQVKCR
jgi:hypothetical protein